MSITAERRFGRMDAALEDLDLSLDIARRFTQSQEMRNLQAQFLFLRWDLTSRLNRPEEAARTLTELIDLSQTWATDPERPLGVEKEILVVSTLWRQGHLLSALALADTSLVRQRGLHKVQSPDSLALGGMIAMLSCKANFATLWETSRVRRPALRNGSLPRATTCSCVRSISPSSAAWNSICCDGV